MITSPDTVIRLSYFTKKINKILTTTKRTTISKAKETREELPTIPDTAFVANRQKQQKTNNKYKPESITIIKPNLKTVTILEPNLNTIRLGRKSTYPLLKDQER